MDATRKRLVKRWTRTAQWRDLELDVLSDQPFCAHCEAVGTIEPSMIVDHIAPHRGEQDLFWSRKNLQGLCYSCHGRKSQHERFSDKPYRPVGVALDGTPMASRIASDWGGRCRGGAVAYGGQAGYNRRSGDDE
ncbi:MAG: HNH endonuclease [Rhizobiales bacterium]|nr:HNH endonuclease [Hyphomicrobiales bacterium]